MKKVPLISVIIPCYNYDKFLPDACESLIEQTCYDWECILVNNGRFADTKKVVDYYVEKDSRFRFIECENSGPSAARNEGLKISDGNFIQFLDADDKLASDRFSALIKKFEKKDQLDLVYTKTKYFSSEQTMKYFNELNDLSGLDKAGHFGDGTELYNKLMRRNIFAINSPLFRRSLLSSTIIFNTKINHLEDWDFWIRLSGKIRYFEFEINDLSSAYVRSHAASLSQFKVNMQSQYLPVLFSNMDYRKLYFKNIFLLLILSMEFLLDALFRGNSSLTFKKLFLAAREQHIYSEIILHFLLIPLYLPLYLILKIYRKLQK